MKTSAALRFALGNNEPSPEQWAVISSGVAPIVVAAGAGSGKTAIIAARIVYLCELGLVKPSEVLGLTFTRRAARELSDRLIGALTILDPTSDERPRVETYHAFADTLVKQWSADLALDPNSEVLSLAAKWEMIERLIEDQELVNQFAVLDIRHALSFIPATIALSEGCSRHLIDGEGLAAACELMLERVESGKQLVRKKQVGPIDDNDAQERNIFERRSLLKRKDLAKLVDAYSEAKRKNHKIDYGDQIRLAVSLLTEVPAVAREIATQIKCVILDEYQDTDPAQREMIKGLVKTHVGETNICAVGDLRQAIFGWRGASLFNLVEFGQDFPHSDGTPATKLDLSENYRCAKNIVELANRIIAPIPSERGGSAMISNIENGQIVTWLFADEREEANKIAEEIDQLIKDGTAASEIAVLVRSRAPSLVPICAALDSRSIPYDRVESGGITKNPAVVDVLAWLNAALVPGPASDIHVARLCLGPAFRVGYGDLAPLARWKTQQARALKEQFSGDGFMEFDLGDLRPSYKDALAVIDTIEGVSDEARVRLKEFSVTLDELVSVLTLDAATDVRIAIQVSRIDEALESSGSISARKHLRALEALEHAAAAFVPAEGTPDTARFLAFLDVSNKAEDTVAEDAETFVDAVQVLTIHAAKGLEFDAVFIPALAASQERANQGRGPLKDSVFPNPKLSGNPLTSLSALPELARVDRAYLPEFSGNKFKYVQALKDRALEEERRLLYVATTRARKRLYFSSAWWYSPNLHRGPSDYFDEIRRHKDLVESPIATTDPDGNPLEETLNIEFAWPVVGYDLPSDLAENLALLLDTTEVDVTPEVQELANEHVSRIRNLHLLTADSPMKSVSVTELVWAETEETMSSAISAAKARALGTAVHAAIEDGAAAGGGGQDEIDAMDALGFTNREHLLLPDGLPAVEVPFVMRAGNHHVSGRIDVIYELENGGIEIVDFKTGRMPEVSNFLQLQIYAEAAAALGLATSDVKLSFVYLSEKEVRSEAYAPRGTQWIADLVQQRVSA